MRGLAIALAAIVAGLILSHTGKAARDMAVVQPSADAQELIVLEAPNCIYCAIFRRDVLPSYQRSKQASALPIRFLDINNPAADQLSLASSVTIVPTVVLMRGGSEVGRISGYTGPEAFFHSVSRLVSTPE